MRKKIKKVLRKVIKTIVFSPGKKKKKPEAESMIQLKEKIKKIPGDENFFLRREEVRLHLCKHSMKNGMPLKKERDIKVCYNRRSCPLGLKKKQECDFYRSFYYDFCFFGYLKEKEQKAL